MMKVERMKLSYLAAMMIMAGCSKNAVLPLENQLSVNVSRKNSQLAQSPAGDIIGKITVGYQGWFACKADSSYFNNWWHWSAGNTLPTVTNVGIAAWPDVRNYTTTYQTGFANLGNGQPATLFSSFNDQTIAIHFQWMKEYGIDAAAIQRFNPSGGEGTMREATMVRVKSAAEANGVKFYVMYDISSWDNFETEIKTDWTTKMSAYTTSSA